MASANRAKLATSKLLTGLTAPFAKSANLAFVAADISQQDVLGRNRFLPLRCETRCSLCRVPSHRNCLASDCQECVLILPKGQ